jgi:hypothetical protein
VVLQKYSLPSDNFFFLFSNVIYFINFQQN